jgi:osmoprotectant transport system permease protein
VTATTELPPGRTTALGVLVTPLVLVASLAALFWYLSQQQLDDIEVRSINATTILTHLREHVALVAVSSVLVIVIAVPLGVLLTRPRLRFVTAPLLGLANVGQAIPSIGILVLLAVTVGIGFDMAVLALVLVAVLPVLRNTMVGLSTVDGALIDAARGMGLSRTTVLFRVELPLAVPVILAGIRIALILNVSSATLATFTNAGGLGTLIATGVTLNRLPILITGSVLTAVLALAVDWLAGLAERALRPRGI